ncbi:hypothetical protein CC2G_015065 [Coprinopsis cinerea AmutBmut pab1-1]|nr:hypothetical protein CC2G_015065 [Coprinopsis cinerea AmutBmut pab1-1]
MMKCWVGLALVGTWDSEYTKAIGDFINHSEFFEVTSTSMYQGALKMISNKIRVANPMTVLRSNVPYRTTPPSQAPSSQFKHATPAGSNTLRRNEAPLVVNDIWTTGNPFFSTCPPGGPGLPSLPTGITESPSSPSTPPTPSHQETK